MQETVGVAKFTIPPTFNYPTEPKALYTRQRLPLRPIRSAVGRRVVSEKVDFTLLACYNFIYNCSKEADIDIYGKSVVIYSLDIGL